MPGIVISCIGIANCQKKVLCFTRVSDVPGSTVPTLSKTLACNLLSSQNYYKGCYRWKITLRRIKTLNWRIISRIAHHVHVLSTALVLVSQDKVREPPSGTKASLGSVLKDKAAFENISLCLPMDCPPQTKYNKTPQPPSSSSTYLK